MQKQTEKKDEQRKRFYVSERMQKIIDDRKGPSRPETTILNMICDRYAEICRRAQIEKKFTENEMMLMRDSMNGTIMYDNAVSVSMLYANIEDSITLDALDKKWEIDGTVLVEKVKSLSYPEMVALADSIEVWWEKQNP
jgi:hypothetical protein